MLVSVTRWKDGFKTKVQVEPKILTSEKAKFAWKTSKFGSCVSDKLEDSEVAYVNQVWDVISEKNGSLSWTDAFCRILNNRDLTK